MTAIRATAGHCRAIAGPSTVVTIRRFCAQTASFEPTTSGGSLPKLIVEIRRASTPAAIRNWRFLVIEDRALRRHLRPACWNQSQITTASALVVILALKSELKPETGYAKRMLRRLVNSEAELEEAMEIYRDIVRGDLTAWSAAQCHIAAAQMMMAAAVIGVDSCPMGGFSPEAVAEILKIDRGEAEIALPLALGYRAGVQPRRHRLAMSELAQVADGSE